MMKKYEIRDPIVGFIAFNEWEKEIINSAPFQRLRRIRQLALTDMVYPGALYSRFEHSLGVMHLATLMFDAIVSNNRNKKILETEMKYREAGLERDKQMIRLAALLHDIGHAPFSHASEEIMPTNPKTINLYQHEDYSVAIINGPLKSIIEDHEINENNYKIKAEEVSALLEGKPSILKGKIFWKTLISSQLDADRGDYLLRDSHHIGVKYGVYDYQRLLNTIALGIDPESGDVILGVDEGGWHVAEAVVLARYQMFTQVYFHKTRRAYDYHLKEALQSLLPGGKLPSPQQIEDFLKLDDFYIWELLKKNGKNSHCRAILERKHIRKIYSTPEIPNKSDEAVFEEKKQLLNNHKIWYHIDNSKSAWYKMNEEKGDNKEIMIIDAPKSHARPLSTYSRIAKNIGTINQLRIYVRLQDKEKAREIIS
jgi:HD superfamily phosphohydrolase